MKTTTEILKSLNLKKGVYNNELAKNYLNIIKLINELKNDIIDVQIENIKNDVKIIITTDFSKYEFLIKKDTQLYSYFCVLLKIQNNDAKKYIQLENIIYVENELTKAITKAKKFINKKHYNDIFKYVFLEFKNYFVRVYSTNGYAIYRSQKFLYVADKNFENLVIPINESYLDYCKPNKDEFFTLEFINTENVIINNQEIEIQKGLNFEDIKKFSFDVGAKMEFQKTEMQKSIKSLKPLLNYKNILNFHLNGSVQIKPITDEKNNTEVSFNYLNKNFDDLDFCINYDNFNNALNVLNSKNIIYSPKNNFSILSNELDSILMINF